MILLNESEMENLKGGELTLMAVMTVLVAAIVAVIIYRLFMSDKGSTSLPGGFKFSWG
jgi:hypothetical protein